MLSIYTFKDYKTYLRGMAKELGITLAKVAESGGIHRQYLNQVLNGKAHLTDDQVCAVGRAFGLDEEEILYFLLLLQESKAARPETRKFFTARRKAIQTRKNKLASKLAEETEKLRILDDRRSDFYLDLRLQLCHAHFFVPEFQQNPARLMEKLRLSKEDFEQCTARLIQFGMLERRGKAFHSKMAFTHLDKDSLISQQNHRNWRTYVASLPSLAGEGQFFFSSTVTSDRKTRAEFVQRLSQLIAEFHRELPQTQDEEVFQLNLDVFAL